MISGSCAGLSGKDSSFPSLPASPPRLSNLPGIPQALRKNLCAVNCRHSAALRCGPIHSQRKDNVSRSSIYCRDCSARRPRRGCRFESSLRRQALRERNSRLGPYNGNNREKPVFEAHFAGPGVAEAGSELPCFGRQKGKMFSYRREIPCYFWSGRNRVPLPCGTITFLFCLHLSDYKQNG